jgi:hypothetical protein
MSKIRNIKGKRTLIVLVEVNKSGIETVALGQQIHVDR